MSFGERLERSCAVKLWLNVLFHLPNKALSKESNGFPTFVGCRTGSNLGFTTMLQMTSQPRGSVQARGVLQGFVAGRSVPQKHGLLTRGVNRPIVVRFSKGKNWNDKPLSLSKGLLTSPFGLPSPPKDVQSASSQSTMNQKKTRFARLYETFARGLIKWPAPVVLYEPKLRLPVV